MFDLGLERAGMTCIGQVEIDARCQSLLRQHWPNVPKRTDIMEVKGAEFGPADVVVGGWPCQGNSVAGKRGGMADPRSGLFHEFVRVADESAATWLLGENVPGILSVSGGRDWSTVLEMLSGFRPEVPQEGWHNSGFCRGPKRAVAWRVLDAQYGGVPQRRRRVFVVGHIGDGTGPLKVLFEPESCSGNPAPRREAGARVADPITRSFGKHGGASAGKDSRMRNGVIASLDGHMGTAGVDDNAAQAGHLLVNSLQSHHQRNSPDGDQLVYQCHGSNVWPMGSLRRGNGNEGGGVPFVSHALRSEGADASEDGTGRGTPLVISQNGSDIQVGEQIGTLKAAQAKQTSGPIVAYTIHGSDDCKRAASETDTAQCLRGRAPGTVENSSTTVAFQERGREAGRTVEHQTDLACSLNAPNGGGRRQESNIAGSMGVRRLTPKECERLQGLPDDWTAIGADGPLSDSARYRIIGNGGVVPELEWIGRRIVEFTAKQKQ
jgi:DNA (cytosine-5)-methyltransferase 1